MPNAIQFPENPNRDYIRKFKKTHHMQNRSNDEVKQIINILRVKKHIENQQALGESYATYSEGDLVNLNIKAIKSHPDYERLSDTYKEFVNSNAGKVFTVEYDSRHQENPMLVCLKEDSTEPKWLWWEGNLMPAKE